MHPLKLLFQEINRDWGIEPPRKRPHAQRPERRRFRNLGALLLMR